MTIKGNGKDRAAIIGVLAVLLILEAFLCVEMDVFNFKKDAGAKIIYIGVILFACAFLVYKDYSLFRVFVMDERGCTVKYLWLKKFYSWDELTMKQYVILWESLPSSSFQVRQLTGAVFSKKKRRFKKTVLRKHYDLPFFICVSFKVKMKKGKDTYIDFPDEYPVDEEEFRARMKEWGVELEPIKNMN